MQLYSLMAVVENDKEWFEEHDKVFEELKFRRSQFSRASVASVEKKHI